MTLESIKIQTFKNYEHIIIDGLSNDKSLEVINSFDSKGKINIISEKDYGIYDAMNKGIKMSNGEYVIFLNSGDSFADKNTLSKITKYAFNCDVLIGSTLYNYRNNKIIRYPENLKKIKRGMTFNHQSAIYNRSTLSQYLFDLSYPISSVHDQTIRMINDMRKFKFIDVQVAIYDPYGISSNAYRWSKDYLKIIWKYYRIYLPIAFIRSIYRNLKYHYDNNSNTNI